MKVSVFVSNVTGQRLMAGVLAVILLLVASHADASVRAWLDRSSITMGETVTLNVESGDAGEPDFSVLEKDFRIAGRSTNSQLQIINGAMARTNLSAVALEPLHEGVIEIPPILVGRDLTAPMSLTVRPMARGSAAKGDDVFLEVEVDTNTPYVQQQVAYTVRLYYAVSLLEGNLDEPAGDGLQVRRIGDDVNYSRQVDARRYNVVERRYAIAADRSGSVTVPSISFRGRIASGGRYGSFLGQGTPLTTGSEAIVLDVRPAPAGAPTPWVPAQSLRLSDDAARLPTQAKVGDALELTLHVEATGLSAEQIPELTLPGIDGAEIYPDQEVRETSEVDGRVLGKRSRKFAIVPLREGALKLPERSLSWWNLATDQAQRSTLPARTLEVLPAAGGITHAPLTPGVSHPVSLETQTTASSSGQVPLWQGLALFFAIGWLLTLAVWYWRSRAGDADHELAPRLESNHALLWRPALAHALTRGDLAAARRALLRLRPDLDDLSSLAAKLESADQREAVQALDRVLYRGDAGAGLAERLRTAFARTPTFVDQARDAIPMTPTLPPLYPSRDR